MDTFLDFCKGCFYFFGCTIGIVFLLILLPTTALLLLSLLPLFAVVGFFVVVFRALFGTKGNSKGI